MTLCFHMHQGLSEKGLIYQQRKKTFLTVASLPNVSITLLSCKLSMYSGKTEKLAPQHSIVGIAGYILLGKTRVGMSQVIRKAIGALLPLKI